VGAGGALPLAATAASAGSGELAPTIAIVRGPLVIFVICGVFIKKGTASASS
jgi:hypothetical protein